MVFNRKKSFRTRRKYVSAVRKFNEIKDKVMDQNYQGDRGSYLRNLEAMEVNLIICIATGIPLGKHYAEFRRVKRELIRRKVVTRRDIRQASNDAWYLGSPNFFLGGTN